MGLGRGRGILCSYGIEDIVKDFTEEIMKDLCEQLNIPNKLIEARNATNRGRI
jgi:hypothetical protein